MDDEYPCWFCGHLIEEGEVSYFSTEWDCWYHETCYKEELLAGNPEALIIYKYERSH
jgi:hypothetical protein